MTKPLAWTTAPALVLALAAIGATGCATKKYVQTENKAIHTRIDEVQGEVEKTQTRLDTQEKRVDQVQTQVAEVSQTAQDALQRAQEAGKLAQGKLLYETVLTDDKVRFGFNHHELSTPAKSALDEFADKLKTENKAVYVEIQGHTDNVGSKDYNERLGLERAESVRRYLNQQHGFPLHRINVISYGATASIDTNKTREGRAHNRRVNLVVLE
jgi:peptidoglycan-associated lipoprotein